MNWSLLGDVRIGRVAACELLGSGRRRVIWKWTESSNTSYGRASIAHCTFVIFAILAETINDKLKNKQIHKTNFCCFASHPPPFILKLPVWFPIQTNVMQDSPTTFSSKPVFSDQYTFLIAFKTPDNLLCYIVIVKVLVFIVIFITSCTYMAISSNLFQVFYG